MKKCFFILSLAFLSFFSSTTLAAPLPAEQVFHVSVKPVDPNSFLINFTVKPGYFLYADRIHLTLEENAGVQQGRIQFPPTVTKKDRLGKIYPIYRNELALQIPVLGQKAGSTFMSLGFQGCSDKGFCYPPETRQIQLNIDEQLALTAAQFFTDQAEQEPAATTTPDESLATVFSGHYWPVTLLMFFGFGLLLAFTPCVLPMIPVLSGIILGHDKLSTQKAFALSLSYVVSMATTYALIGIVVASLGENLQIIMQAPLVITAFSILFVILALSMFGLFDLKLPVSWQSKLAATTRAQSSGHYISAAIMGSLSTLVLSPCVTAPLVGALGYIAENGNIWLGGGALFTLGLGMGAPLLLIGTSAGKYLPKAGQWMNAVKSFFGFLLLAMAIHLLSRIAPASLIMACWAILLIIAGIYVGAFIKGDTHRDKLKQSLGIGCLVYGLMVIIGAGMGNTNPLQPLTGLAASNQGDASLVSKNALTKKIVTNLDELKTQLAQAEGRPVLLDFYADWCVACKVMEATTFQDPQFKKTLAPWLVIQVDITQNTAAQRELLKSYRVVAPPSFIFINAAGQELNNFRLVGEIATHDFIKHLNVLAQMKDNL